jgi:hypothetical protein
VRAVETVLQPDKQIKGKVETQSLVLLCKATFCLGEALFGKPRVASCNLVLFLKAALGELRLATNAAQRAPMPVAMPPSAMTRVRSVSIRRSLPIDRFFLKLSM